MSTDPPVPPVATPEAQAAADTQLLSSIPKRQRVTVPIRKLLKHPMRYVRGMPETVDLVGVNTLGAPLLIVSRRGTQLSTRGQGWAITELLASLPSVKESPPITPATDAPTE